MAEIYTQALASQSSSEVLPKALAVLRPYFPTCIPLYRRLQFQASFTEASLLLTSLEDLDSTPQDDDEPWLMAFLDRSRRPETELWIFGSWEVSQSDHEVAATELLSALLRTIKSLPIPESIHATASAAKAIAEAKNEDPSGISRAEYAAHSTIPPSEILLGGAIHQKTTKYLEENGLLRVDMFGESGRLIPNHHYYFNVEGILERFGDSMVDELPQGVQWGELSEAQHWELVKSRTQIPRQERTLAQLPNVAIFPTDAASSDPVAWAFVGIDASLTSLHVEPEWRGKGLAKKIMVKLFRDKMDMFWEEGVTRWAHDFVIEGNVASVAVSESVGGKSEGAAYWLRADLSKA